MWSGGAEEGNYYCDNTLNYHNLTIDNQPSTHFTSSTNTKGLIDWKTCISVSTVLPPHPSMQQLLELQLRIS